MRAFLSILFFFTAICLFAQEYEQTCYFGFGFEVSNNPRWGFGEPVITRVDPYSNAEKAGLKVGDVIMQVNDKATYLRHYSLIASWIFDNTSQEVSLTIRNLNNTFKEVILSRYCRNSEAITEDELADWFSLYSVGGNNKQHFTLPLTIYANAKVDFSDYYTYDFVFKNEKTTELDDYICHQIEKTLNKKGLTRSVKDPDILIQIYYSYQPNKHFDPTLFDKQRIGESRFDVGLQRMVNVPVAYAKKTDELPYVKGLVDFGFQFFEKKYINPGKMTQIWDIEMKEYITDGNLENYCQMHVPLMIAAYPYHVPTNRVNYTVDFKEYNYTGIVYNRKDLSTIDAVDENSPAQAAGLHYGDKVLAVNGILLPNSDIDSKNAYADFVSETMVYRDTLAEFYNEKVKDNSYPWSSTAYGKIRKEFRKKNYIAGFSYLFAFESYINSNVPKFLTFKIFRHGTVMTFKIQPQKRKSALLEEVK